MSLLPTVVSSSRRTRVCRSHRVPYLELVEPRLLLASFTVTSAADDGAGTLRQVIESLDGSTDPANTVSFDIGSGPQTISLQSALPAITVPVLIDGTSQPGYSGSPLIQIDGGGVQGSGLTLTQGSDGSTIKGMQIYGFSYGAGVLVQSSKNVIESSYLGTDGTRTIEEPNDVGVEISGANRFSFAESNTFTGCTFTGNYIEGVYMSTANSNTFTGCTFTGNYGGSGVYMSTAESNTFTGCTFTGNFFGVQMTISHSNTFTGCNFTGNSVAGLIISESDLNIFSGCTFSGNYGEGGVYMSTAEFNTFTGCNFTDNYSEGLGMFDLSDYNIVTGCTIAGNSFDGVDMLNANDNTVTGCTIAGNSVDGIIITSDSKYNVIDGNYCIGTPSNGSSTQQVGILINDTIENTIGGTTANVIGGNNVGIEISGFDSSLIGPNFIVGNYIGVTEDGSPIGNYYGIWINDVPNNLIGGTTNGAGNTISDNKWAGVYISGLDATGNLVEGNSILGPNNKGTKTDPTNPLPIGVFIQNASSNTIGGAGAGNTIYGNNVGVYIVGAGGSSTNNQVLDNFIGLSADGGSPPGNVLYGVILVNAPNNNAPQSGPSANKIVGSGIANYREYSGPIDPTTQSSSGSGSKAKKPAMHSDHVAHQTPRRTALHAQVTVHGHTVPAGPLRKPRARVRH